MPIKKKTKKKATKPALEMGKAEVKSRGIVVIDFDCLWDDSKRDIFEGADEFCKRLHEQFDLVIETDRDVPDVKLALDEAEIRYKRVEGTASIVAIISDKAVRCYPKRTNRAWNWYKAALSELRMTVGNK